MRKRTRVTGREGAGTERITLEAVVTRRSSSTALCTVEEIEDSCRVSGRTLREWVKRGLPVAGRGPRSSPLFRVADVMGWQLAIDRGTPPRAVTPARAAWAARMHFIERFDVDPSAGHVIVPLAWNDPTREAALRRAAAGVAPAGEDGLTGEDAA